METTFHKSPNGTLGFTTFCTNEPEALRAMIESELNGWAVTRCTKLGDGTRMVQGVESTTPERR